MIALYLATIFAAVIMATRMTERIYASYWIENNRIGCVTSDLNRHFKPGAMLIALDIAAPLAGDLPAREDLVYFVTHPCHPSVFGGETEKDAQNDFFGGVSARQNIVFSLVQGPEENYAIGEKIGRAIYSPVGESHCCTADQMAILEPVLSETVLGTCLTIIGEVVDEAVKRGVPEAAARDFVLGHLKVELGIVFKLFPGATFSDGALKAIDEAKSSIFQPDWKKVFDPAALTRAFGRLQSPRLRLRVCHERAGGIDAREQDGCDHDHAGHNP